MQDDFLFPPQLVPYKYADLPTTVLGCLLADFHFFGLILAPLLISLMIMFYVKIFFQWQFNALIGLSALAAALMTASYAEASLAQCFTDLRNFSLLCLIGLSWNAAQSFLKGLRRSTSL